MQKEKAFKAPLLLGLGERVGVLGIKVGTSVGVADGLTVGDRVGRTVGSRLGALVAGSTGIELGCDVGTRTVFSKAAVALP